jgi:hypothetical protein
MPAAAALLVQAVNLRLHPVAVDLLAEEPQLMEHQEQEAAVAELLPAKLVEQVVQESSSYLMR